MKCLPSMGDRRTASLSSSLIRQRPAVFAAHHPTAGSQFADDAELQ